MSTSEPRARGAGTALSVAVTGGIGAGKSTVARLLAQRGAVVVDSDQLAREVVDPGTDGLAQLIQVFGPRVLQPDGSLDRKALAGLVFGADGAARRRQLEQIIHPLVRARHTEALQAAPAGAVVVNDIPLIRDLSVAADYQLVIGVGVADDELRIRRLVDRGLPEQQARDRMAAQINDSERAELSDLWLDNSGDTTALSAAVPSLWDRLCGFARNRELGQPAARTGERTRTVWELTTDPDLPGPPSSALGRLLAARASAAIGGVRVDHVGRASVPGGPAEDVIDLQAVVPNLAAADAFDEPLRLAGFVTVEQPDDAANESLTGPALAEARLYVNCDPGQNLNLYLTVRNSSHLS